MIGTFGNCAGRWRGICFSDCFASMVASKYRAGAVAGLLCGTHFLLKAKRKAEEVTLFRLITCYLSLQAFSKGTSDNVALLFRSQRVKRTA